MINSLLTVLAYTLIPVIAALVGGTIDAFKTPSSRMRSAIQHFAAGVVFAAFAAELFSTVLSNHAILATIIGFVLGTIFMLTLRWLTENIGRAEKGKAIGPTGLIVTTGADIIIDGFLIGIGFAAGEKQGIILTIALAMECERRKALE